PRHPGPPVPAHRDVDTMVGRRRRRSRRRPDRLGRLDALAPGSHPPRPPGDRRHGGRPAAPDRAAGQGPGEPRRHPRAGRSQRPPPAGLTRGVRKTTPGGSVSPRKEAARESMHLIHTAPRSTAPRRPPPRPTPPPAPGAADRIRAATAALLWAAARPIPDAPSIDAAVSNTFDP